MGELFMDNILKQAFIENFNVNKVVTDLMDLIEEDKLMNYIIDQFNDNFSYGELYDLFKDKFSKKGLQKLLEDMTHEFVDLDKLSEKEKEEYY